LNKVFYDSDCSFCRKIKSILSRFDIFQVFKWITNKDIDTNHFNIKKENIDTTIILITNSEKKYSGFKASRYIMMHIPVFWPITPLLFTPFISVYLGDIIYRNIAKNRNCKIQT